MEKEGKKKEKEEKVLNLKKEEKSKRGNRVTIMISLLRDEMRNAMPRKYLSTNTHSKWSIFGPFFPKVTCVSRNAKNFFKTIVYPSCIFYILKSSFTCFTCLKIDALTTY